jgi:hypothetical protein
MHSNNSHTAPWGGSAATRWDDATRTARLVHLETAPPSGLLVRGIQVDPPTACIVEV